MRRFTSRGEILREIERRRNENYRNGFFDASVTDGDKRRISEGYWFGFFDAIDIKQNGTISRDEFFHWKSKTDFRTNLDKVIELFEVRLKESAFFGPSRDVISRKKYH